MVGLGGTPLMTTKMGKGDMEAAAGILSNCFRLLLGIAAGLSALFFVLRRQFLWWFGASADTFPYAMEYITVYIAGTAFALLSGGLNSFLIAQGRSGLGMGTVTLGAALFMAVQWTCVDMSTALGEVRLALFCSMFRKSLFLGGILLFPLLFSASAAFAAEPFCDITASILSGILFLRFLPGCLAENCHLPELQTRRSS